MIEYYIATENGQGLAGPTDKIDELLDVIPPDGKETEFFIFASEGEKSIILYEYSKLWSKWVTLPISKETGLPYKQEREKWIGFSKKHEACSGEGCEECYNGFLIRKCCMFCSKWTSERCKHRASDWCCSLHTLNEREHILYQLFDRRSKRQDLTGLAKKIYNLVKEKPINEVQMKEAIDWGMLTKDKLNIGHYYFGGCRNASVALWDGKKFWYMRTKFNQVFKESIVHPEDDEGYDIFTPIYSVNPKKSEIIVKEYIK